MCIDRIRYIYIDILDQYSATIHNIWTDSHVLRMVCGFMLHVRHIPIHHPGIGYVGESIHIKNIILILWLLLLCTGVASGYTQDEIFKSVEESTPELTRFIVDTKIPITEMKMQFNELQGHVSSYNIQKDLDGSYKLSAIINPAVKDGRLGYQIDAIPIAKTDKGDVIGTKYLWWNASFPNCHNVSITAPSSTLSNYAKFIHISNTSDIIGGILRFVDKPCGQDGIILNHSTEYFNMNDADYWVKLLTLSSGNNTIISYYSGNANISDSSNSTGVWDSRFIKILHFKNESFASDSLGLNGASWNALALNIRDRNSNINRSVLFDASGDLLNFSASTFMPNKGNAWTISFWRNDTGTNAYSYMVDLKNNADGILIVFDEGNSLGLGGPTYYWGHRLNGAGANNGVYQTYADPGGYVYYVFTYNGGAITAASSYELYINGVKQSSGTPTSIGGSGTKNYIGEGYSENKTVNMMLDELRIYNTNMSLAEIQYNNLSDRGMFSIYNQESYISPQNFSVYSPVNTTYNLNSLIPINYTVSNSTDPVSYQINLHNASNNDFLWTVANNAGFLNYLWNNNASAGQYRICVIANNSIGENSSNCSAAFSIINPVTISFLETIPTFTVLPNIDFLGNYTYSDHTGVAMTSNCSFLTIKPDNYSSPFTRYYDYDCSPFMSGGIVSLMDLTHTAVIYQSDYTPVRFYLYDKIRFQGLCGDTTMTYNLHEWDQYGDGSFDWDSGTFLNSYFYYDHTQLGDPYAVTLREGNTDADYYEGHGFNPGGLIILDAQPYNISYTRNISQYGNNYCRLNVTGANASNLSNTFLVNVTDTPPVFNDTYNLTSTTENYTHIVMGYDPENDPFTGLGCNISGMTISWILIPINTTSCCNVTLNDTVLINETEYCYTHVSTPPEPSYTMKYLDCDIDDTSKIILYFICFIICIFSTIILLWLRLGILEIIGGFIMIFIGGYFFSCFMFCIAMFVCAGLSLICKGLTDIS